MARNGSQGRSTHGYAAYGLTFSVPFRCRGLPKAVGGAPAEVMVRPGTVPRALKCPVVSDERWDAEPGRFLLRGGRRAGRFLVQDGDVTLERNPAAEEEVLARCFTEEVLPAVLRQRGLLVLHANAALTSDGVVAIGGESGAGKSTTLAALLDRGCAMLADDITAVALDGDGHVHVQPGVAQVNLTAAAVSGLGYRCHPGLIQPRRPLKSALATEGRMAQSPGRLAAIYLLSSHDGPDVRLRALAGMEKFEALQSCIYGPLLREEHPGTFPLIRAVLATAVVYRLQRPAERWSVPELVQLVLSGHTHAATADSHSVGS